MITTRIRRRLASLLGLLFVAAALTALPAVSLPAQAAVETGDLVFENAPSGGGLKISLRKASDGSVSDLLTLSGYSGNADPDVSPDGSKIAYEETNYISSHGGEGIWVMNSDGSGQTQLTFPDTASSDNSLKFYDTHPRWSHDGTKILFTRKKLISGNWVEYIYTMDADGSSPVSLTNDEPDSSFQAAWSPGSERIVYVRQISGGYFELRIMDADGDNKHTAVNSCAGWPATPDWSPDGSRIYYFGWCSTAKIQYATSSDNFATAANSTEATLYNAGYGTANRMRVSGDGAYVYYDGGNIYKVDTSTGSQAQVTTGSNSYEAVSPVNTAWPPAPPSNSDVAVSAPSPSDAPFTRQITINLSTSGVSKFQYGWSTSSSTAPNTSYLQESTDLTAPKMGTLNYLGVYSGSGTTWNGGTQPNQDWYLWVRSVQSDGVTPNSWATPLKVHTPRRPVWVGAGDSYSSGHHQTADEPLCPTTEDTPWFYGGNETECVITGAPHLTPNDLAYSWVKEAVDDYNADLHLPTDPITGWSYGLDLVAKSGAWTSAFGVSGETPGTEAWASGSAQSYDVRADLYSRYDSWNVVSMTGGANDAGFSSRLADYYKANFVGGAAPWGISTSSPSTDCPDSEQMWTDLHAEQLDSHTLDWHIKTNLQGVVTVATNYSPGVRVIDVGYPNVVNTSNDCYSNVGSPVTWHGLGSVVDDINANHAAVTGSNHHYIDLTDPDTEYDFGSSPVTAGYLQLTRLYGYPHPSADGQTQIANAVVYDLMHSW